MRLIRNACFISALIACALLARPVSADTVSIAPADTTVNVTEAFTLRVETPDAMPNLKAYQLVYHYDATLLQFTGASAGDVLTGTGRAYTVLVVPVGAPGDTAWVDCAMLDGVTSGPGVLAYLHFTALAQGDAPITCVNLDFRDALNQHFVPACVGGLVRITGPTDIRQRSWGQLKILYRP